MRKRLFLGALTLPLLVCCTSAPPCIPDKVETLVSQSAAVDDDNLTAQFGEIEYYMRTHDVTDEGYHLIAQYHTKLLRLQATQHPATNTQHPSANTERSSSAVRYVKAKDRLLPVVKIGPGHWQSGHYHLRPASGPGLLRDYEGRIVKAVFHADTTTFIVRSDSTGTYQGQADRYALASGQGTFDATDGSHYEGFWQDDLREGFGFESSAHHALRVGTWRRGRFLGEKMKYTTERIYGIDISRHQHEKGRRRYAINWKKVRITSLGQRHKTDGLTFPVSFVYIKATESTSIRNRYFLNDYRQARRQGIHVGAYHFFSLKTSATSQAAYFLKNVVIGHDDFPPVLDVEPTDAQIRQIGGDAELMRRIRTFLEYVESHTHKRPILYVSQSFIKRHMADASDIKQRYNVWIARYGEYRPDVRLVYWQLSADGRVSGITGPVDINVFNGYQGQWDNFIYSGFHN